MSTLGIDLGGTKLALGRWEQNRLTHFATELVGTDRRPDVVLARMAELARPLLTADTRAVGVACAGQIRDDGVILCSPNLGWENVPLARVLEDALHLPVRVGNDVQLALVAEHQLGAAQGSRHCVGVFVGTGIGGGLILNDEPYRGATGSAAEIGHMTLLIDGPACGCGNFGCWEALASGPALARRTKSALDKGRLSRLHPQHLNAEDLERAIQQGDLLAREMVEQEGRFLGIGLANLMNLFNPERIVMGGGVIRHLPQLVDMAEHEAKRRALAANSRNCTVASAQWGREAGVIGAALAAESAHTQRPAA